MIYALGLEDAICLGLVHGLTQFLPLSSDAHVALAETLLDLNRAAAGSAASEQLATLHACLRAGTLLACLCYFRARIAAISVGLWRCLRSGRLPGPADPGGDAVFVAIAAVPTLLLGLLLQPLVLRWQGKPLAIGFGLVLTALWLTASLWARAGSRTSSSWMGAAVLGTAQGIAWLPGLSRSAANLTLALWLGLRAERAFELAMLATLPAMAGGLCFELSLADQLTGSALVLLSGALFAFGAGLSSLYLLRRIMQYGHVAWCALWLLPVALASLALAKAWPG
ncbi:MAG TPA: undecaprenyl-diphosphate phosphatase [Polyangiaceae bacterium]|jgi:undecaprenyl-diphosphatase|nr:undecaprenyl-diphosphate phosphatase [Polyangiaceae bacterium]